jgi:hypothetical protein
LKVTRTVSICILLISGLLWVPGPASAGKETPTKMSIACIDWFLGGGHRDHIHVEIHVEDASGNGVIGATVQFANSYDRHDGTEPFVYQTPTSTTTKSAGKVKGAGCADPSGSGVTGWFCCIGAGKHDGDIPGKRACPAGFYSTRVLSVTPPAGSSLVWDGVTPPNGKEFAPSHA